MERDEHKKCVISALTDAQKIAFDPLTFQAVNDMLAGMYLCFERRTQSL